MSAAKVVKRYANRKLYDTERSCYVTLDDIAVMIRGGDEVKVVDNKSGEDLTSVTFAQIIFETEKKKSFMPRNVLRDMIRDGGDNISEIFQGSVEQVQAKAIDLKDTARDKAQKLKSGVGGGLGKVIKRGSNGVEASKAGLNDLVTTSQQALDELQKGMEDRVRNGVGAVSRYASLGRDMDDIRERLTALKKRLSNF